MLNRIESKRAGKRWLKIFAIFLGFLFLFAAVSLFEAKSLLKKPASTENQEIDFEIEPGWGVREISKKLEGKGLLKSPTIFLVYLKYKGLSSSIKAGNYLLNKNMNIIQVVEVLTQGKVKSIKIIVPEGWRLEEIAAYLEKENVVSSKEFLEAAKKNYNYDFLKDKPADQNLEGYLFPDTYFLSANPSADQIVEKMLENFSKKFSKELQVEAKKQGSTIHEALTLASIVEREVDKKEDREIVAGILKERLRLDMPLQADATNHYLINDWKKVLTEGDLKIDSPYNTRIKKGLPPGPIASPGLESIKAALYHKDSDYFYYLSKDGKTYYSYTQEEHDEKKAKYLQ